jgi:hypothetical protein
MIQRHRGGYVRTLGVDLAASPATTAACMITWNHGQAVVDKSIRPLDDARLLGLLDDLGPGDRAESTARSAGRPTSSPLWSRMPVANAGQAEVKTLSSTGRGCGCD